MRVCLIGNNLTNFVLAKVLADKKLSVDIIFDNENDKVNKTRTIGISRNNFNYLKSIFKKKISAWPISNIKIFGEEKNTKELMQFNKNGFENFFIVKYQEIFLNFKKVSQKKKLIKIFKINKKIDENFLSKKNYDLIINTDKKSYLTKKYCYKKIEKNYNSFAFTTLINHEKVKNNTAFQYFTNYGILAFLPLSDKITSIVFSLYKRKQIDEEKIKKFIEQTCPYYKISSFSKFEKFSLKLSLLRNYSHKNILFFGDLIHRVHPLAGQGFNMTLRDIKILSLLIDQKIDLGMELNNTIFDSFQKKTKHLNHIFVSGIDFVHEFFRLDTELKNNLSKSILPLLNKNNYLNKYAIYLADEGLKI